ncbi:MAG: hypothetical protein ACLR17_23945 [Enterobacteriaceae bacterium]|nr:hypothetical protein [Raoultella ornithinolytica]ALQ47913.1 hypothetical protein ATN83_3804 [Raoultella ornithinolytica]HDT5896304.1 hypothetical protein [Raoultella ornithinolytica]
MGTALKLFIKLKYKHLFDVPLRLPGGRKGMRKDVLAADQAVTSSLAVG